MNIITQAMALLATIMMSSVSYAAQTPAGDYSLDKSHTHIGFSISHLGVSNTIGRFNTFNGSVKFTPNGDSKVNFTIDADSVDTNNTRRDNHVRSEDFFDVDNFPDIIFSSTAVTYDDNGDPKSIKGNLELHGEENEVTFEVKTVGAGETQAQGVTTLRAGYIATTKIDRREFGITSFPGVVGNDVTITVNIEITKPE